MKNQHSTITKAILLLSVCALLALYPTQSVFAQSTTVKVEPSTLAPVVGETLTVNITISNVQNLFGVDATLYWNNSMLKVLSHTSLLGVESHPNGVLHENIEIVNDTASQQTGTYTLSATSLGQETASFSGSGTIATLTFNLTDTGRTTLEIQSELADKPANADDTSEFISHTDVASSIDVAIPEFPTILGLAVLIVLATGALVFAKKHIKKNTF
jgi:hypothetical protein